MADDIAEFLRRAAQRRAQQGRPAPPIQFLDPKPPLVRAVEPEVILDAEVTEHVSQSVARDLDAREFEQRTNSLGQDVRQLQQAVEGHVQQTFDHRLGDLNRGSAPAVAAAIVRVDDNPLAAEVRQALASPASIRQSIILAEVLARPEHLWQ